MDPTLAEQCAELLAESAQREEVVERIVRNQDTTEADLAVLQRVVNGYVTLYQHTLALAGAMTNHEIEDACMQHAGLPAMTEILHSYDQIRHIRDQIVRDMSVLTQDLRTAQIPTTVAVGPDLTWQSNVLTPPDVPQRTIVPGEGGGVLREFHERLTTLLCILYDLRVCPTDPSQVRIDIGPVLTTMVREITYASVFIPHIARLVEICNQVGNRSFIWFTDDPADVARYGAMTKEQKQQYLLTNPHAGCDLVMRAGWEPRMRELLIQPLPGNATNINLPPSGGTSPVSGSAIASHILHSSGSEEESRLMRLWKSRLKEFVRFRNSNGKWPNLSSGFGRWIKAQRDKRDAGKLTAEQIQLLSNAGIDVEKILSTSSAKRFVYPLPTRLDEFKELRARNAYPEPESPLFAWLELKRRELRDGKLSAEAIKEFLSLGVTPAKAIHEIPFADGLSELKAFLAVGTGKWPGFTHKLWEWLRDQRKKLRDNELGKEDTEALLALGVTPLRQKS